MEHMEKLKDDALVGNSVRLVNEYDFPYPEVFDGKTVEVPQVQFILQKCRGHLYFDAANCSCLPECTGNCGSATEPTCGQDLRCQGHAAIPSTNQPYGTMDGGGCITKVIRQCLFLHCKEPVFAVSNQSSRCCIYCTRHACLVSSVTLLEMKMTFSSTV